MKSQPLKLQIYKVLCLSIKHHSHAPSALTHIVQSLQYTDHLSEPMAELLAVLSKEFDHNQLAEEVLREIGGMSFSASHGDSKGPRSFSKFLIRLAELVPRLVTGQISLLLPHIDSEVCLEHLSYLYPLPILTRLVHSTELSNANGARRSNRHTHS